MGDFVAFAEEIDDGMSYLEHHGILGMRWGRMQGPPYPLGSGDHTDREKKLARRAGIKVGKDSGKGSVENLSGGSTSRSKSPRKTMSEEEKRAAALDAAMKGDKKKIAKYMDYLSREELQEAENRARVKDNLTRQEPGEKKMSKAEMEKMEAIRSGDKEKVKQFADQMSYAELAEAMNKVDLTNKLNYTPPPPTITDKINNVMNKVSQARDWAEKGIAAYNTMAKIYNSTHPDNDGWPEINPGTKQQKKEKEKEQEITNKLLNNVKKDVQQQKKEKEKSYEDLKKEEFERRKMDYEYDKKIKQYVADDKAKAAKAQSDEARKKFDSDWDDAIVANKKFDKHKDQEEREAKRQLNKDWDEAISTNKKIDKDRDEAYEYNDKLNKERLARDEGSAYKENDKRNETQRLVEEGRKYDDYMIRNWNAAKEKKMSDYSDMSYDEILGDLAPTYKEVQRKNASAKLKAEEQEPYYDELYSILYNRDDD